MRKIKAKSSYLKPIPPNAGTSREASFVEVEIYVTWNKMLQYFTNGIASPDFYDTYLMWREYLNILIALSSKLHVLTFLEIRFYHKMATNLEYRQTFHSSPRRRGRAKLPLHSPRRFPRFPQLIMGRPDGANWNSRSQA